MTTIKTLSVIAALGAACVGCVSDPYIDEGIAKLDRIPKQCKLPECYKVVEPFPKEKLLGEWFSNAVTAKSRRIDCNGIYETDCAHIQAKEFGFFDDCSYYMVYINSFVINGEYKGVTLKCMGGWVYDKGVLMLNAKKYDLKIWEGFERKVKSCETKTCNRMNTFNVVCYENGEMAINEIEPKDSNSQSEGEREVVTIDNRGVKTERTIKVTGMRGGREVGTIDEKIVPPMRLRRKSE